MKRLILSLSILFVSLFLLKSSPAYAEITQITNTENGDYAPKIDGDYIVWTENDNIENDVYLYTISTGITIKVADNANDPQIDNNNIVYSSYDNTDNELFVYDINANTTTQITNNDVDDYSYQIDNNQIVWINDYGTDGIDSEVFLYDISTNTTTQITSNNVSDSSPDISSGKIVWDSYDTLNNSTYEIFMYDVSTNTTSQITNNSITDWGPRIDGDKIIWERDNESWPRTIYAYDIPTETEYLVTTGNTGFSPYQIDDGKVVWQGINAQGGDAPYEIFITDLTSLMTTQITDNEFGDGLPQINDGNVVWVGGIETSDIYTYNITSGITNQITNGDSDDSYPQTSGGKIVWQKSPDNIFFWDGLLPENEPPVITALTGSTINDEDTYSENGSFSDSDSSSWTGTVNYGDGSGTQTLTLDGTNFSLEHEYTTPGEYTVTVTITDEAEASGTATATVTVVENTEPVTVTINASGDSYVKGGQDHRNYGEGSFMKVQSSGSNRSIVKFDQNEIASAIGSGTLLSAKIQLTITDNGNNWGSSGRTVDIHRMLTEWSEGNGTENDRGTADGTTWACATDSNISNQSKNCSGDSEWEMGQPNNPSVHPWAESATATQSITNNQSGIVEYDVTSDLQSFLDNSYSNYGWLIKKTNEGQNGMVSFGTRESSSVPQLVITYQP